MPTSALHPFHRIDQLIRRRARPRPDRAPRPRRARAARLAASTTALLALGALGACTGAPAAKGPATSTGSGHPAAVTVRSCGATTAVSTPPKRLVTLNEGATEVALALGLQTRMAGTAYLDDTIPAQWKAAYDSVPVLSKEYPTKEKLLAAHPDFLYASYASAFTDKVAGTRAELDAEHIPSYLSPFGCADSKQVPAASFAAVWGELTDVAKAFGVTARATAIEQRQKKTLAGLAAQGAGRGLNVLWYDSDTKTPFVGAGHGGPQLILDAVGAHNVFGSLPGGWQSVSWEKVAAANPDAIVLADAGWDTAKSKIAYLEHDPVLSRLTAVRKRAFVVVPFSESTPGVLLADGASQVSAGLAKLHPAS
ncbi:ABC transporter substrate-binding protein [Streptomyces sp. NBC_00448]|uniref:ABC transporter substrate-binding protein n=1 Tax=Streptomyces sp. NBC_00448 TaxID=2903652 RepID=UPI002E1A8F68